MVILSYVKTEILLDFKRTVGFHFCAFKLSSATAVSTTVLHLKHSNTCFSSSFDLLTEPYTCKLQ